MAVIIFIFTINASRNDTYSFRPYQSTDSHFTDSSYFNFNKTDWASFSHHVQKVITLSLNLTSSIDSFSTLIEIINYASHISIDPKKYNKITYHSSLPQCSSRAHTLLKTDHSFSKYIAVQVPYMTSLSIITNVLFNTAFKKKCNAW